MFLPLTSLSIYSSRRYILVAWFFTLKWDKVTRLSLRLRLAYFADGEVLGTRVIASIEDSRQMLASRWLLVTCSVEHSNKSNTLHQGEILPYG